VSGDEERRRKLLQLASAAVFLAIAVVVVLIVVAANRGSGGDPDDLRGAAEVNRELAGIPQRGLTLGPPEAPARLVEFGDLKCPYCASVSEEIMPAVIDSQVRGGGASVEFRNFPIIDAQSETAGAALLAAGEQRRGWNFLEIFYRNQGLETAPYADDEFLTAVARAAGVRDIERWNRARRSPRLIAAVQGSKQEAERLGFDGTPSFAVEGPDGRLDPLGVVGSAAELEAALEAQN
jgi:protein-disulfide isomerase